MSGLAKSRTWSTSRSDNGQLTGEQQQQQQYHKTRDPIRKTSTSSTTSISSQPFTTATSVNTLERTTTRHSHVAASTTTSSTTTNNGTPHPGASGFATSKDGAPSLAQPGADSPGQDPVAAPSFLQPRIAAILGVSRGWHPVLFSLRLLSIVPAICLGFPLAIRFLLMVHEFATAEGAAKALGSRTGHSEAEERLLLTETMLAVIWVGYTFLRAYVHARVDSAWAR